MPKVVILLKWWEPFLPKKAGSVAPLYMGIQSVFHSDSESVVNRISLIMSSLSVFCPGLMFSFLRLARYVI